MLLIQCNSTQSLGQSDNALALRSMCAKVTLTEELRRGCWEGR